MLGMNKQGCFYRLAGYILRQLPGAVGGVMSGGSAAEKTPFADRDLDAETKRCLALAMLYLGRKFDHIPFVETDGVAELVCQTLDRSDVELARDLLIDHSSWNDAEAVGELETEFAKWNGSRHAFAFLKGRVALSACIHALELQPGDEVIIPGYTCVVVPNAFVFAGVKPVYCDIELDTYGLDANLIEDLITPKTKAIMLQHLYGLVCRDYDAILDIAKRHGLRVIEDCCHSTGAEYRGMKVGNLGDVAFYSSERSKIFSTVIGGIAVTNDDDVARGMLDFYNRASYSNRWTDRQLVNVYLDYFTYAHPQRGLLKEYVAYLYENDVIIPVSKEESDGTLPDGYYMRMTAPAAKLGLNQLAKVDRHNESRRRTAKKWDKWCDDHGYGKPLVLDGSVPVYLRYPVLVEPEKKTDTSWAERELNVRAGVWFRSNLHPVPGHVDGCPNADKAVRQCINFPCL